MVATTSKAKVDEKKSLRLKNIGMGVGRWEGVVRENRRGVVRLPQQSRSDLYPSALGWLCPAIYLGDRKIDIVGAPGRLSCTGTHWPAAVDYGHL